MATPPEAAKTLEETISDFYTAAVRDFPNAAGRLFVLNAKDNTLHGVADPNKTKFLSQDAVLHFVAEENNKLKHSNATYQNGENSFAIFYAQQSIGVIYFNGPHADVFVASQPDPLSKNIRFILEHELGHLVVTDAHPAQQTSKTDVIFAENAADVFSILQLGRHYGAEEAKNACHKLSFRRAFQLMSASDGPHFTSFAVQELEKIIDRIDFDTLTGEHAQKLAWRLAQQHAPQEPVVRELQTTFAEAAQAMQQDDGIEHGLSLIAKQVIDKNAGAFATRFANILLVPYLQGKVKYDGEPCLLQGDYWDDVRVKIDAASKRLEEDGVLFGLPQKKAPDKIEPLAQKTKKNKFFLSRKPSPECL